MRQASLAGAASPPNALVIGTNLGTIPSLAPTAINARTVSEMVSSLSHTEGLLAASEAYGDGA